MLKKLEKYDFEKYADRAYEIALDRTRSCYPTYTDGIKTKEDFFNTALKTFECDTDEILLFCQGEKVCGWIHYYALKDDRYIGIHSFNIESGTETALKEFEEFCRDKFKGYDLYAGFPEENISAVSYLKENGYELLEKSCPTVFHFECAVRFESCKHIGKIEKETYYKFEALHSQTDDGMYWNCERILKTFENWIIFYYDDKKTQAAIYLNAAQDIPEIFGVDFNNNEQNPDVFSKLIKSCLNYLSRAGAKHLYYFAEENEKDTLLNLGFKDLGGYSCYLKKMT